MFEPLFQALDTALKQFKEAKALMAFSVQEDTGMVLALARVDKVATISSEMKLEFIKLYKHQGFSVSLYNSSLDFWLADSQSKFTNQNKFVIINLNFERLIHKSLFFYNLLTDNND